MLRPAIATMPHARALHRSTACLALLAALLLALAPALTRVVVSGTPTVLAGWSDLCTRIGLQRLPSEARAPLDADGGGLPAGIADEVCGYCPLAASLLPLLPPVVQVHAGPAVSRAPGERTTPTGAWANFRGIGSRGPPGIALDHATPS